MTSKPQATKSEAHLLDDDDVPDCSTIGLTDGPAKATTTAVQPPLPLSSRSSNIGAASTVNVRGRHAKRMTLNFPIVLPEIPSSPASPSETDEDKENVTVNKQNNKERRASLRKSLLCQSQEEPGNSQPSLSSPLTSSTSVSASPSTPASTPVPRSASMVFGRRSATSFSARSRSATNGMPIGRGLEFENPYEFLTLMAAQERKVMELKEELQKAESELSSLKRRWSTNERSRRTSEFIYNTEPMTTFNNTSTPKNANGRTGSDDPSSGSLIDEEDPTPGTPRSFHSGRFNREILQRGRASSMGHASRSSVDSNSFMISPIRSKPRTVFNGSRHQRNLSLVSSIGTRDRSSSVSQSMKNGSVERSSSTSSSKHQSLQPAILPRSSTLPSSMNLVTPSPTKPTNSAASGSMLKSGQQMMLDVKDNIWMLFEEVKNVAAPSDGVDGGFAGGAHNRDVADQLHENQYGVAYSSSPNQPSTVRKSKDHDPSAFWRQFGLDAPESSASTTNSNKNKNKNKNTNAQATSKPTTQPAQPTDEGTLLDFDNWDDWDAFEEENHSKPWKGTSSNSKAGGLSKHNKHTPSSSISTDQSRRGEQSSPSTASSSPPMSASFTELTGAADGPRTVAIHVPKSRPAPVLSNNALPSPPLTASRESSVTCHNVNTTHPHHNRTRSSLSGGNGGSRPVSEDLSTSHLNNSDSIPWPTIVKDLTSPSKLVRTASSMLAEWDNTKSPSPPAVPRNSSPFHHARSVSASASPSASAKSIKSD